LVTKGYHFPDLTLVGVIDADIGLEGGDLRASERSFQQITQVSGRAGRSEHPGTVYIQTRNPETPVMAALLAGDRDGFYAAELQSRELAMMPPFGRLAAIIISSEDEGSAKSLAEHLGQVAPQVPGFDVYGPAPAPLSVLRGRYRYRLLVQAKRTVPLQQIIADWLDRVTISKAVRLAVDVDPYSFV
jgi:primosomal protein N' (replication factor Y)